MNKVRILSERIWGNERYWLVVICPRHGRLGTFDAPSWDEWGFYDSLERAYGHLCMEHGRES